MNRETALSWVENTIMSKIADFMSYSLELEKFKHPETQKILKSYRADIDNLIELRRYIKENLL